MGSIKGYRGEGTKGKKAHYPEDDDRSWMSNRDKTMEPKMGMFWCDCDLTHVWCWKKCDICHRRVGRRRMKK